MVATERTLTPTSSNIAAYSYDPASSELTIEFRDGDTYRYSAVPVNVYEGMQRSGSVGKFFYRQVKDRYAYIQD